MRRWFPWAFVALVATRPGGAQPTRAVGVPEPPRPSGPLVAARYPDILRGSDIGGTLDVTFTVDTSGRVLPQSVRYEGHVHDLLRASVREALRAWRFVPARMADRPVESTVSARFRFRPTPASWREQAVLRACVHCDQALEAHRSQVAAAALRHRDCARALREVVRTDPTDTLAWAVDVLPRCDGASTAAGLAVRLMAYGHHPDSTHALRTQLATTIASAEVFEAALAVAARGRQAGPQLHALEVLHRLGEGPPRALAAAADAGVGCGPYLIDGAPVPAPALRAAFRSRVRELAARLGADASRAPTVRRASRCLLADL